MGFGLKKSLVGIVSALSLYTSAIQAQTHEYDVKGKFVFYWDIGNLTYNETEKRVDITITKPSEIEISYQQLNDSTFIETNFNEDKHVDEMYKYIKRDSTWVLDEYFSLNNRPRKEKVEKVGQTTDSTILSPLAAFKHFFSEEPYDKEDNTINILIFGEQYQLEFKKKYSTRNKIYYSAIVSGYKPGTEENFIIDDELVFSRVKNDSIYSINSIHGKDDEGNYFKVEPKDD